MPKTNRGVYASINQLLDGKYSGTIKTEIWHNHEQVKQLEYSIIIIVFCQQCHIKQT